MSDEIDGCLRDPDGPRIVLVRGERGVGRSAFVRAAAERLRAAGIAPLPLPCVPGDGKHALLLALRIVMALEKPQSTMAGPRPAGAPALDVLSAVERGDRTAMAEALTAALAHSAPVTVVVDDAQHADADSLTLLNEVAFGQISPDVRLIVTSVQHAAAGEGHRHRHTSDTGRAVERLARGRAAHTIVLPRLELEGVTAMVARRLQAAPSADLVQRVHQLSRGIPGAVDVLLTEWAGQGAIRIIDRHALLARGTPVPLLPDGDRYLAALHALGEPCRTVAAALSVLWPLGRTAAALVAASTSLSADAVADGIRSLVDEGIVDELAGQDGATPRGWTFRVPLMAHTVQEQLGPLERSRLSAAAVEALWAAGAPADAGATQDGPMAAILDEADAQTYLPNRIVDAGILVDRERAVAELPAAAGPLYPDPERRGTVRWLQGAARLIDQPTARDLAVLRCGQAAYGCGDYPTARSSVESILHGSAEGLDLETLHDLATLLVATVAAEQDWPALSRMSTAGWWHGRPLPAPAILAGRVQALIHLEKWQEALALLSRNEPRWRTDVVSGPLMEVYRICTEYVLGQPDRLALAVAKRDAPDLPRHKVFAVATAEFDFLIGVGDLNRARDLLSARGVQPETLYPRSVFLWLHLQGRWDEALVVARWILGNDEARTVAPGHHLVPARMAAVLLARGSITSVGRLLSSVRGQVNGPLEHVLDHVDAEVLRALGDLGGAKKILRRGLSAADERGSVYGTDELWASLAEVYAEEGHTDEAVNCLRRLEQLAKQMNSGRSRLLYLLTSVRVLQPGPTDTRDRLLEAVDLARSRNQPFETAVTLSAAARTNAAPATLLHEAYELFGEMGAALWRFHTRAAMREAGLIVPGRKQATAESEHLLATLISEGLTNRQIATVLQLSEDAVANRLSRLFTRTGLRSRTELVTAVLTGSPLN
ncbi:DNA-binding CsgD family transcriptional regulator/tetratricopeptide (TPR) repeat protein [Streptomyces sp. LBL]|uniref:LuxR family transcriptional regulator n=1 Tax=Streptomyces sp. LBL TaxID=2940562 RepID=UPI00247383D5|nr:LuxR family transcriptional regulator [Streptomyces sp. LBL]MDH6630467.1 DNA-binding CsgD family transcriptional regulator/tetratricopeptide (TPR) repeat protein [Streptomyces sp. LBL]